MWRKIEKKLVVFCNFSLAMSSPEEFHFFERLIPVHKETYTLCKCFKKVLDDRTVTPPPLPLMVITSNPPRLEFLEKGYLHQSTQCSCGDDKTNENIDINVSTGRIQE